MVFQNLEEYVMPRSKLRPRPFFVKKGILTFTPPLLTSTYSMSLPFVDPKGLTPDAFKSVTVCEGLWAVVWRIGPTSKVKQTETSRRNSGRAERMGTSWRLGPRTVRVV